MNIIIRIFFVLSVFLLPSCYAPYFPVRVGFSERKCQLLIGQNPEATHALFGSPKKIEKSPNVMYMYWEEDYVKTNDARVSFNRKYTNDWTTWNVTAMVEQNRITGLSYRGMKEIGNSDWLMSGYNQVLFIWIGACSNNNVDEVKRFVERFPDLLQNEARLYEGAMQAAKYDADEVLIYYMKKFHLDIDKKCDTWARGEEFNFVLTQASLREILKSRNHGPTLNALKELAIAI